jgi:hypothetical protein
VNILALFVNKILALFVNKILALFVNKILALFVIKILVLSRKETSRADHQDTDAKSACASAPNPWIMARHESYTGSRKHVIDVCVTQSYLSEGFRELERMMFAATTLRSAGCMVDALLSKSMKRAHCSGSLPLSVMFRSMKAKAFSTRKSWPGTVRQKVLFR